MIDGEEVIRSSQIHVGCLYLPLIIMGIGLMIGVMTIIASISYGAFGPIVIFSFLNIFTIVGLIWFIIRFYGYKTNDLILTNKRVFGKCGLISTTQMQSSLNKIDSVSFSNGLIGKIIGYGTVQITTQSSVSNSDISVKVKHSTVIYSIRLRFYVKEKVEENAKAIARAIKNE